MHLRTPNAVPSAVFSLNEIELVICQHVLQRKWGEPPRRRLYRNSLLFCRADQNTQRNDLPLAASSCAYVIAPALGGPSSGLDIQSLEDSTQRFDSSSKLDNIRTRVAFYAMASSLDMSVFHSNTSFNCNLEAAGLETYTNTKAQRHRLRTSQNNHYSHLWHSSHASPSSQKTTPNDYCRPHTHDILRV